MGLFTMTHDFSDQSKHSRVEGRIIFGGAAADVKNLDPLPRDENTDFSLSALAAMILENYLTEKDEDNKVKGRTIESSLNDEDSEESA